MVAGSARSAAWFERVALGIWLLAAGGLAYRCISTGEFGPSHLAGAAALVISLALLARNGLVRVLGPVLAYDVLRNARRGRFILMRWLYAVGLLLLLLWVYSIWRAEGIYRSQGAANNYRELTRLSENYFVAFSITQFLAVALLTPAYVAGAIAEEKEKKTLEFLLATDLENREIIFGKLVSRVGNLALFILTGLPVLSLMQFFGGIDPGLLMASFAATGITAASLAGLSILNSTLRRRARDAIVLTYLAAIGYLAATGATQFLKLTLAFYGALDWGGIDWTKFFDWFHAGNPIFGVYAIAQTIDKNGPLQAVIADELREYAIFHGIIAVGSVTWAVLRLRAIALGQSAVVAAKPRRWSRKLSRRRSVGDQPMFWKEFWIEGRLRFGVISRVLFGLLIGASFIPVVIIFYVTAIDRANYQHYSGIFDWCGAVIGQVRAHWREIGEALNFWLRVMNVVIGILMLLGVAVRAAGSVGAERDRDTLTSLMTTTLTTGEIMLAKWWGALWSVRGFLWWLIPVWLIAIIFGGANPLAFFLHALAFFAPAMCFASIGLWYSARCRTTLRATAWTIATAILVGGGHWLCMGMCCYMPLALVARGGGRGFEYLLIGELAVTPPYIFGWDPFREFSDLQMMGEAQSMPVFAGLGIVVWCFAALIILSAAKGRFEKLTNRGLIERAIGLPSVRLSVPDAQSTNES